MYYGSNLTKKQNAVRTYHSPTRNPKSHSKKQKKHFSIDGALMLFSYIAEIGLTMIPGLDAGVAPFIIAELGASARLGIAFHEKQISIISEVIDFASGVIPTLNEGIHNVKFIKSLTSEKTAKYMKGMIDSLSGEADSLLAKDAKNQMEHLATYTARKNKHAFQTKQMYKMYKDKLEQGKILDYLKTMKNVEKNISDLQKAMMHHGESDILNSHLKQAIDQRTFLISHSPITKSYIKDAWNFKKAVEESATNGKLTLKKVLSGLKRNTQHMDMDWDRHFSELIFKSLEDSDKELKNFAVTAEDIEAEKKLRATEGKWINDIFSDNNEMTDKELKGHLAMKKTKSQLWKKVKDSEGRTRLTKYKSSIRPNKGVTYSDEKIMQIAERFETRTPFSESEFTELKNRTEFKDYKQTNTLMKNTNAINNRIQVIKKNQAAINSLTETMADLTPKFKTSKGYVVGLLEKGGLKDIKGQALHDEVRQFILSSSKRKAIFLSRQVMKAKLSSLQNILVDSPEELEILNALFRTMGQLNPTQLDKLFRKTSTMLSSKLGDQSKELEQAYHEGLNAYYKTSKYSKLRKKYKLGDSKGFRYKKYGKHFKVTRFRNLINPMTAARAIPDTIYQTVKTFFDKFTERSIQSTAKTLEKQSKRFEADMLSEGDARVAERMLEEDKVAKDIFVKNGGMVIPENRYILGFKVIPEVTPIEGENMILFMYNKLWTGSKNKLSKNYGGKKSVLAFATDYDIEQLTSIGVQYYWEFGKEKGWYENRGGRQSKLDSAVGSELSLFLGFVPTNDLRNVLTLFTSTVGQSIRWIDGRNFHHLRQKYISTMIRTSLNRMGRLFARYPVRLASQKWLGISKVKQLTTDEIKELGLSEKEVIARTLKRTQIVGKAKGLYAMEFQRYLSLALSLSIVTNSKGNIAFGSTRNKITNRLMAATLHSTTRQVFTRSKTMDIKLATDYRGRKKQVKIHNKYIGSYVKQIRGGKRRLAYMSRVKGAFYSRALPGGAGVGRLRWK